MSDLTERLRDLYDTVQSPSVHDAADLIDAIDALHQQLAGYPADCQQCVIKWPCPTHQLIHPEVVA